MSLPFENDTDISFLKKNIEEEKIPHVDVERLHKKYINEFVGVDYSLVRNWSSIKAKKAKK